MDLDTYSWIPTIQAVKTYLEVESGKDDPVLGRLTNAACQELERMAGRQFVAREYTNVCLDGDGSNVLVLPQFPVKTITSLYIGRTSSYAGSLVDSDHYEVDAEAPEEGLLRLLSGYVFTRGVRNIVLTYEAGYKPTDTDGYHTMPADLVELLLELVAFRRRLQSNQGEEVVSRSMEGATVNYARSFWTKDRKAVINRYRRVGF